MGFRRPMPREPYDQPTARFPIDRPTANACVCGKLFCFARIYPHGTPLVSCTTVVIKTDPGALTWPCTSKCTPLLGPPAWAGSMALYRSSAISTPPKSGSQPEIGRQGMFVMALHGPPCGVTGSWSGLELSTRETGVDLRFLEFSKASLQHTIVFSRSAVLGRQSGTGPTGIGDLARPPHW